VRISVRVHINAVEEGPVRLIVVVNDQFELLSRKADPMMCKLYLCMIGTDQQLSILASNIS